MNIDEYNRLPAEDRLFMQFGTWLRHIAELMRANAFSMQAFDMMEMAFRSAVGNEVMRAYQEGRQDGQRDTRYWEDLYYSAMRELSQRGKAEEER